MVQGPWTTYQSGQIVPALSKTGYAYTYVGGGGYVRKTLAANYSRLIGGIRFQWQAGAHYGPIIRFEDVTTPQCGIQVNTNGTFSIVLGEYDGATVLATSTVSTSQDDIDFIEWDITFGTSAAYHLWLNGASILSGTGNTITTSDSYANGICLGDPVPLSGLIPVTVDDLYLFDSTTSHNNAVNLNNPRIESRLPNSDTQTQFTNESSLLGSAASSESNFTTPGSNTLFLRQFTSQINQTINSVSCLPNATVGSANFKAVIYSDSAGSPHTLLSSGVQATGTTAGTTLTSALVTPQSLVAATPYWIGFIGDSVVQLYVADPLTLGQIASNTYTSGAPSTAPTMTINQNDWLVWGNCSNAATNWESMAENPAVGDLSAIDSDTVGNEDLYGVPNLDATTATIYSVGVRGNLKRSDSGARTVDLRLKSGSTDSAGSASGFTVGQNYQGEDTYYDQDPNGSIAWTLTTANAVKIGPKIAS
jgi:hypothetical protein